MSELELNSLAKVLEANASGFRAFADALPHFVWLAKHDGTLVFLNEPLLRYTGLSEHDALERGFSGLMHPDDVAATRERWERSLRSGRPFESEYRLRNAADDTYRWFLTRALPVRGEGADVQYWIGTTTDVDDQHRANENLDFVIEASGIFASVMSIEEICEGFAHLAVRRFADLCLVVLTDPVERYKLAAFAHRDPQRIPSVERFFERYPLSQSRSLERMMHSQAPTLFATIPPDIMREAARDDQYFALMQELHLYSAIVAPLKHAGELLGGIIMYSAQTRRQFTAADADVLQMLAERAAARIATTHTLRAEQRERRRLQFLGRATQAVYESLDLTSAFGNLARILVSGICDMAAVFRVEDAEAVRVIAAAHSDAAADDTVRSFVGIRVMHGDSEKRFVAALQAERPLIGTDFESGTLAKTVWPYLSEDVLALGLRSMVTIPLHLRGKIYGAIVAYYTDGGRELKSEDVDLLAEIARHASIAMENADVFERERRMSETLQDSLLPPSLPQVDGIAFDAVYLPGATEAQVGGDWYDAFELEDGAIVVTAGDVTGRGADAAVIMGKVRNLLAIAPSYERDPARILDTVESVLARRYPDTIVTAFLGFIDPQRRTLTYANAGHPAPLLRRSASVEEVQADGLPIGLRREAEPAASSTASLHDARMLVLFTDGLAESGHDVLGGYRKLREVVERDALLHTHRPARFIEEACLGNAASDDVAVMTISFAAGVRWSFDAENAKAAQDARGEFVAYLRAHAADSTQIETAELVFGELVGNVVRHAPGAIDIDLEWTNGSPRLHVLDRGQAFHAPSHLPDLLSESGRGLFIVRKLSEGFHVEHVPGYGNHVAVDLPLRRKHE